MIFCASITGHRDVIEDGNLRFAVVPGHEAGKDESSVHKLARMLSAYYGRADTIAGALDESISWLNYRQAVAEAC